ncbi:MAG: hypothetical protein WCH43_13630 [Verrucomicrobiota bacterium]
MNINHDDYHAKLAALRIGLLPGIQADLRQSTAPRAAAGIGRDGNQMTAVIAWAGFDLKHINGWITVSILPICHENTEWLIATTRILIGGGGPARLEEPPRA